jgi:hypothetical protein
MGSKSNLKKVATGSEIERIANDIVDLVEHTDGPVLLSEIDGKVTGFAASRGPAYSYFYSHEGDVVTVWHNMTSAGYLALRRVLKARRVAVQLVNVLPYLLKGIIVHDDTWQPIVLLPARAATLETPNFDRRLPQKRQQDYLKHVRATGKPGYRPLSPRPVDFTADQFCI